MVARAPGGRISWRWLFALLACSAVAAEAAAATAGRRRAAAARKTCSPTRASKKAATCGTWTGRQDGRPVHRGRARTRPPANAARC